MSKLNYILTALCITVSGPLIIAAFVLGEEVLLDIGTGLIFLLGVYFLVSSRSEKKVK